MRLPPESRWSRQANAGAALSAGGWAPWWRQPGHHVTSTAPPGDGVPHDVRGVACSTARSFDDSAAAGVINISSASPEKTLPELLVTRSPQKQRARRVLAECWFTEPVVRESW
jgi:hypothetical protein